MICTEMAGLTADPRSLLFFLFSIQRVCYNKVSEEFRASREPTAMFTRRSGYSLVETLVCLAIISILMALYLPSLVKARRKAEEVAIREGFRQSYIGGMADNANSVRRQQDDASRDACRAAFREKTASGNYEIYLTRMLYAVRSEAEFRAYWHTLIDPAASGSLNFDNSGNLIAEDENGNKYTLMPLGDRQQLTGPIIPIAWEFLSSNFAETSSGTSGTSVLYSDGHVGYVPYPSEYPACRAVAELSHRFVQATS